MSAMKSSPNPIRRGLISWLAAPLVAPLASAAAPAPRGRTAEPGEGLRDVAMRGLNGPDRALSDYFRAPLLINVWASWCGPCRAEMASIERLAWMPADPAFQIIGISTDDDESAAKRLLASTRATLPHFIDRRLELETLLGASRIPLTVIVGVGGTLLERIVGAQAWDSPASVERIRQALRSRRA